MEVDGEGAAAATAGGGGVVFRRNSGARRPLSLARLNFYYNFDYSVRVEGIIS